MHRIRLPAFALVVLAGMAVGFYGLHRLADNSHCGNSRLTTQQIDGLRGIVQTLAMPRRLEDPELRSRRSLGALYGVVSEIDTSSRTTLNEIYSGWGDVVFAHWLPAVKDMLDLAGASDRPVDARERPIVTARVVDNFTAYDQWTVRNQSALAVALRECRLTK